MLVASHITEGNSADQAFRDFLKKKRSALPVENLNLVLSGSHKPDRPISDEDFVLVHPWPNKNLVIGTGILQGFAWAGVGVVPSRIHHQSLTPPLGFSGVLGSVPTVLFLRYQQCLETMQTYAFLAQS